MTENGWREWSARRRAGLVCAIALQITLAAAAWRDLAHRRPDEVNGSKPRWAAIIAINFVGPVVYFWRGRRASH